MTDPSLPGQQLPPIYHAIVAGDRAAVRRILAQDAAQVHADIAGDRPIHAAVGVGSTAMVKLLLDAGAEVNARGDNGRTPLHAAVEEGVDLEMIRLLLSRGADASLADAMGMTPLAYCPEGVDPEMDKAHRMLKKSGAPLDLTAAVRSGDLEAVERILAANPDFRQAGPSWETLLVMAVMARKLEMAELLLEHGFPVNAGPRGQTALFAAVNTSGFWRSEADEASGMAMLRLLLRHGADPDKGGPPPHETRTPLWLAEFMGKPRIAELLRANRLAGE